MFDPGLAERLPKLASGGGGFNGLIPWEPGYGGEPNPDPVPLPEQPNILARVGKTIGSIAIEFASVLTMQRYSDASIASVDSATSERRNNDHAYYMSVPKHWVSLRRS